MRLLLVQPRDGEHAVGPPRDDALDANIEYDRNLLFMLYLVQ